MTPAVDFRNVAARYSHDVAALMELALTDERPAMTRAMEIIGESFAKDGLLYVFGSGHSHMFAEEAFFRAGGSPRVAPMLIEQHMLHLGAERSTQLERQPGLGRKVVDSYPVEPTRDALLVVSNSGANPLPVEVALRGREIGVPVLAITSVAYSDSAGGGRTVLHQVADVVIDNHCPPGDALIEVGGDMPKVGPGSSVIGFALLNTVLVGVLARQMQAGRGAEVFVSAGMPNAASRNEAIIEKYRTRIRHI